MSLIGNQTITIQLEKIDKFQFPNSTLLTKKNFFPLVYITFVTFPHLCEGSYLLLILSLCFACRMFLQEEATLKNTLGLRLIRALGPLHVLYRKCHNAIALPWILIGEKYSLYIICNDSNKSDCDVNYVNESNFNFFYRGKFDF